MRGENMIEELSPVVLLIDLPEHDLERET